MRALHNYTRGLPLEGGIDGKHIITRPPHDTCSCKYNDEGRNRIVLMTICVTNYEF